MADVRIFPHPYAQTPEEIRENFETLEEFLQPEPWKPLAPLYVNGWVDYEAGSRLGEYRKNPFGVVELRGVIKNGTSGTVAFTLPVGYRPATPYRQYPVVSVNGMGQLITGVTGEVTVQNLTAGSEVKTFCFLEPIFFATE